MDGSMGIRGLIAWRAERSARRRGVERQFARVALLIVTVTTRRSVEYDVTTKSVEAR
jgi:hypothetical protein